MSQEELARAANVPRSTIGDAETGRRLPSVLVAVRIAKALKKPVEYLFYEERR